MQTMERTEIIIDGDSTFLAQDQDLDRILRSVEAAANGPAAFVEFVAVGNRRVRVLVTPRSRSWSRPRPSSSTLVTPVTRRHRSAVSSTSIPIDCEP